MAGIWYWLSVLGCQQKDPGSGAQQASARVLALQRTASSGGGPSPTLAIVRALMGTLIVTRIHSLLALLSYPNTMLFRLSPLAFLTLNETQDYLQCHILQEEEQD